MKPVPFLPGRFLAEHEFTARLYFRFGIGREKFPAAPAETESLLAAV